MLYAVGDIWTSESCGDIQESSICDPSEPDCACNSKVDVSLGEKQLVHGLLTASHNSGINASHIKTLC